MGEFKGLHGGVVADLLFPCLDVGITNGCIVPFSRRFLVIAGIIAVTVVIGISIFSSDRNEVAETPVGKTDRPQSSRISFRDRDLDRQPNVRKKKEYRLYDASPDRKWSDIAATLTPERAREMLEFDKLNEPNLQVRAERAWRIINQLCQNGYSQEAWSMIDGDPGIVRQHSINGFFRDANMPKSELLGLLDSLEKKDRATGLSGYWDRFAPEEFVRLNMSEFEIRSPEEKAALRQSLEAMIGRAFDSDNPEIGKVIRQDLLNLAADQIGLGVFAYSDIGKMLGQDPSKDGFAYYEALQRVDPAYRRNQDTLKGTDAQVVRAMVTQDPQRTMDMTLAEGSWVKGKGYVALEKWVTMDYRAAEDWYRRNEGKADRDSSAVAFMRACDTLGRLDEALQWYARIESQNWKNGIGGEMRAIVRKLEAEKIR